MRARIQTHGDLLAFRRDVRQAHQGTALEGEALECVLLALTELGTNLLRHSEGGGTLECAIDPEDGVLRLQARNETRRGEDRAPGLPGGLGIGLDSLHRLMDRVSIHPHADGLDVVSEKRLPPGAPEVR